MEDIRVLIYEDNRSLREALCFMLESTEGFLVAGAYEDCTGILRQVREHGPDVLLMDIDMPHLSGIEAIKLVKPKFPQVNILMLTVFDDDERVFEAIKAGATGYLLKKAPPGRILEALTEIYEGGAPMSPAIARKVILNLHTTPAHVEEIARLTARELEILQLLSEGKSMKMIADSCFIAVHTVRTHVKRIYEKLQVHSVTEALAKFHKR
ncbi:response regulator [Leadbetterella sp. DM7]|uniref:response regulator n=1 Tax=Leadbetterella sp. DM7 TaxID=3235085 RepID=UPI00349E7D5F